MSIEDGGGPAFPFVVDRRLMQTGMTLRDWFAGHAPPMPEQWYEDTKGENLPKGTHYVNALVAWRFFYADAMLAERKRGEGS